MKGRQQFVHVEVVAAFPAISGATGTRGDCGKQQFAVQSVAARTVGEAVLQDQILPLLQQSRSVAPIERVLQNDDVMGEQGLLLVGNIDVEVGIFLTEVVKRHARHVVDGLNHAQIGVGPVEGGVGEEYEDFPFHGH